MSEHEKYEQVGRVAEKVSHLKKELSHVNEKLQLASTAYMRLTQGQNINNWSVQNGKLVVQAQQYGVTPSQRPGEGLLNEHDLIEILEKKQNLIIELNAAVATLNSLAPNLL